MSERGALLVVDGDRFVRESLTELVGSQFDVLARATPQEGLALLEEHELDVVMADYRMGDTDGVQFLHGVRERAPRATRILMSGFLDRTIFTRFISSGLISSFVGKPWAEAELRDKLHHVMRVRQLLRSAQLLEVVASVQTLPTLPTLFTELVLAVEEQKPMKEIGELIERDSSVASRVLHVANSAFFGNRTFTTVTDAAVFLGASLLKDLVLTTELAQGDPWPEQQRQELGRIFRHSFAVNRLIPAVYRAAFHRPPEPCLGSAGIIHDLGKIIVLRSLPERHRQVQDAADWAQVDAYYRAEEKAGFGEATHAQIGAWFLDLWNLPAVLSEIALFHHEPQRAHAEHARAVLVTTLANRLVHHAERGVRARHEGPASHAAGAATGELPPAYEAGVPLLNPQMIARLDDLARKELEAAGSLP